MTDKIPPAADELPFGSFDDEIDEAKVLAQAAAIQAKRAKPVEKPKPVPPKSLTEPRLVHVLGANVVLGQRGRDAWGPVPRFVERGAELVVSPQQLTVESMLDGPDRNVFDRYLDEGKVGFGPLPGWVRPWTYGDRSWDDARQVAVRRVRTLTDPKERREASEALENYYGPATFDPRSAAEFHERITRERVEHERGQQ
ncbi:hypothetical protein [Agrococcus terreus]|uniref:Uncharacterized protein n=1 Tax=Agrococcus terreus TaxID=574649 RepID=A0ABQ2KIS5_9MICO|nr:hypothetical protein [Agrococcus terreus]GGN82359.1 hypothetical protein GCM10010968_12090 [Agrococcus terreus]